MEKEGGTLENYNHGGSGTEQIVGAADTKITPTLMNFIQGSLNRDS